LMCRDGPNYSEQQKFHHLNLRTEPTGYID
jgi:hypothetical protein